MYVNAAWHCTTLPIVAWALTGRMVLLEKMNLFDVQNCERGCLCSEMCTVKSIGRVGKGKNRDCGLTHEHSTLLTGLTWGCMVAALGLLRRRETSAEMKEKLTAGTRLDAMRHDTIANGLAKTGRKGEDCASHELHLHLHLRSTRAASSEPIAILVNVRRVCLIRSRISQSRQP